MSNFKNYINVYEFNCVLPGSDKEVNYKPITTGQMKKLLIYEKETSPVVQEKALDDLISSSVIDKDFKIDELFLEDRFFLLVEMRKNTKGKNFTFPFQCSKCKKQTKIKIDLTKLKIVKLKDLKINPLIKLTKDISIELKHIIRSEQKELEKFLDLNTSETMQMVEIQLLGYAAGITKIITPDGEEESNVIDKKWMIENTPSAVLDKIKDWYKKNTFGIEFTHTEKCDCGKSEIIDIPLNNFFF
jgi:hypothetical protein